MSANPDRTARRSVRADSYDLVSERARSPRSRRRRLASARRRRSRRPHAQPRPPLCRSASRTCFARASEATREIVIWDNGSTDGTAEYLDSVADPRIRVVRSPPNIGFNAYAGGMRAMTIGTVLVELDDDVVDAPRGTGPHAPRRVRAARPRSGSGGRPRGRPPRRGVVRPSSRTTPRIHAGRGERRPAAARPGRGLRHHVTRADERVGGFRQDKKRVFWLEDQAYIADIERLGFGAAVLADLRVHHTGGPYYTKASEEKESYWRLLRAAPRAEGAGQAGAVSTSLRPAPQRAVRVVPAARMTARA